MNLIGYPMMRVETWLCSTTHTIASCTSTALRLCLLWRLVGAGLGSGDGHCRERPATPSLPPDRRSRRRPPPLPRHSVNHSILHRRRDRMLPEELHFREWLDQVPPGCRQRGGKRARLQIVATYIKNGTVLFPRTGCEEMLGEIFNLGIESHDDLCDALVYMVLGLVRAWSCRRFTGLRIAFNGTLSPYGR